MEGRESVTVIFSHADRDGDRFELEASETGFRNLRAVVQPRGGSGAQSWDVDARALRDALTLHLGGPVAPEPVFGDGAREEVRRAEQRGRLKAWRDVEDRLAAARAEGYAQGLADGKKADPGTSFDVEELRAYVDERIRYDRSIPRADEVWRRLQRELDLGRFTNREPGTPAPSRYVVQVEPQLDAEAFAVQATEVVSEVLATALRSIADRMTQKEQA